MSMMPRSTLSVVPPTPLMSSSLTLFVKVMVALRVCGDFSVPISNSPCNMIHSVVSSTSAVFAKLELTVNGHTTQRRRVDVEDHFLACVNGDLVACDGHLAVGPGGRLRPLRRLPCRRSRILRLHDSERADE